MAAGLLDKLHRHRANIVHVVWAPAVAMVAMAGGSRFLTEVTPAATFGEAKLAQGGVALAIALIGRPAIQFVMREFHDAREANREAAFERFARDRQRALATVLALVTGAGMAIASTFGLKLTLAACAAATVMLFVEILLSTDLALALTRNEQRLVSVVEVIRQGGASFASAVAIYFLFDSAAVFLAAQTLLSLGCLVALRMALKRSIADPGSAEEQARWAAAGRRFVIPMLASGLFNWLLNVGDRYVLAHFCTEAEVGRYAAVYGLIAMPIGAAGGILSRFLFPLVFGAAARNDEAAQGYMLRGMLLLSAIIGVAATVVAVVAGPWILRLALSAEYREGSGPLLAWLAAGQACLIVSFSFDLKAYAKKLTIAFSIAAGVAAALNIALNLLWVPTRGAEGAAMATFFGYLAYLVVSMIILRRPERWQQNMEPG